MEEFSVVLPHAGSGSETTITDDRCLADLGHLESLLGDLQVRSLFVVADSGAYEHSGARQKLEAVLVDRQATFFRDFEPNPKLPHILNGVAEFRRSAADLVLAIGGGTAIDIAKLIVAFAGTAASPLEIVQGRVPPGPPVRPLVAVPTTSGSGSEATQFAVVYVEGKKHSVDHPHLLSAYCVLDPDLTARLPPRITAQCGLDAFCQAIESIWSVRASESSLADAYEAAQLAWTHLPAAVHAPTPAARRGMCRAAHLAGRAINRTRTTASHAISYALTSDYGVPHGEAVALTLGPMLRHNADVGPHDVNDPRGPDEVRRRIRRILDLLGCQTPQEGSAAIERFVQSLGCEVRLRPLGVGGSDELRSIAERVNVERLGNNPRRLTSSQLVALLESIL